MSVTKGTFPPIHTRLVSQEDNPFRLPGDDQIFRMREEEKAMKEAAKLNRVKQRIWDKKKVEVKSRTERMQELVGDQLPTTFSDLEKSETVAIKMSSIRRPEKENMTEFIAKKREMFLVQMSLDTKRDEIRKLEEKAQLKEEALQRSEQMLEEDGMRFEAFLKENDRKAHEAIRKAEEETKRKHEKTQDIKRLTQQIQALSSEMSKHKESLEDCLRYKSFLDALTPPEWFENHRKAMIDKRNAIKKERFEKKYKAWETQRRRMIEQHRKELENRKDGKKDKKKMISREEEDEEEDKFRQSLPAPPRFEDEIVEVETTEPPMYFTQPSQLMDIFAALEEQNLFLIQNSQETQYTLDELRQAFKETKLTMDARTFQLQQQIDDLLIQIDSEQQRARILQQKRLQATETPSIEAGQHASTSGASSQLEKKRLLDDLHLKVRNVYELCGFDASSKPSTLEMLSQLEGKLELLLADIERMPIEYVIRSEKEKEKVRRERKREEQQAFQEKQQEERNRRAIERSLQAPKKRTGRQVMYRSKPLRKEDNSRREEDNGETNDDDVKFLS